MTTPSPRALKELLGSKITEKYTGEAEEQKCLGAYTNKQRQDKKLPPTANQILKKWKNIPDIVYSVNKTMRQQLLPTKTYEQSNAQMTIRDTNHRMCHTTTESTTHVLSACTKIAYTLYTARHDRMLRPIYWISTISRKLNMESHGTNTAYRTQCLKMKEKIYIGMCPFCLRSHRKMELVCLT